MPWHRLLALLADTPGRLAAWMRTQHYRRALDFHPTARALPHGRVLNPGRQRNSVLVGRHTVLRGELFVFPHAGSIRIGDWCFIGEGSRIWSSASVEIGDRVLISHDVNIHDTNGHPTSAATRHDHFVRIVEKGHPAEWADMTARPISIGNDAWIGFGSTILKGSNIGVGAIVAAGSTVNGDVPAWTMVAGNPARIIKELSRDQITAR
jgi:acetyltransferase-like isoleucine patch superfamily enzyme